MKRWRRSEAGLPAVSRQALVVIRSAGERTADSCRRLVCENLPRVPIVVVEAAPFSEALRQSFQHGIEHSLPWTICLDADILVLPQFALFVEESIRALPSAALGFQGRVFDRFLGRTQRGHHIYRTALLSRAEALVDDFSSAPRPETEIKEAMAARGHPWSSLTLTVALHDFGQYYRDIFRKMVVRAYRLPDCADFLRRFEGIDDPESQVAAMGLRHGLRLRDQYPVSLHHQSYEAEAISALEALGLEEKKPIRAGDGFGRLPPEYRIQQLQFKREWVDSRLKSERLSGLRRCQLRIAGRLCLLQLRLAESFVAEDRRRRGGRLKP